MDERGLRRVICPWSRHVGGVALAVSSHDGPADLILLGIVFGRVKALTLGPFSLVMTERQDEGGDTSTGSARYSLGSSRFRFSTFGRSFITMYGSSGFRVRKSWWYASAG